MECFRARPNGSRSDPEEAQGFLGGVQKSPPRRLDNLLAANSSVSGDIAAKQRELESLSASYRQYTQDLAAMKADLEGKKTELDQLLVLAREEHSRRSVQASQLKAKLDDLQARIDEMNRLRENFLEQVADREKNVHKFVRKGMTRKQVSTLVGYPDSMEGSGGNTAGSL